MNGTEICDGNDMPYICLKVTGSTVEKGKTCKESEKGTQGSCAAGFTCRLPAICNGGPDNGKSCTVSSGVANTYQCAAGGTCVAAVCSKDCGGSCPLAYKTTSLLVKSQLEGSQPTAGIELYSYLNKEKATPDSASLYFPACRAGTTITANVDASKVVPPAVDVVFVTDLTNSMNSSVGGKKKIQVVSEATVDAIEALYDAYAGQKGTGKMRIGLVSYGGKEVKNADGTTKFNAYLEGANTDSPLLTDSGANKQTLKAIAKDYPLYAAGYSNPQGLKMAKEILKSQPSDHIRIAILLSDGQSVKANDGTECSSKVNLPITTESGSKNFDGADYCTAEARALYITPNPDLFFYSAVISTSNTDKAYMEHFSSMKCKGEFMNLPDDCKDGNYAFNANSPAEIKEMYDTIVKTILNASTTVTSTSGQSFATEPTPSGNNVTLPLPIGFTCQSQPFSLPIRTSFFGTGTIKFDNFVFSYCPIE